MDDQQAQKSLIQVLRRAYSGELAAALAYRGHWKSCTRPEEITGIKQIEADEWVHRRGVGKMLTELGSGPSPFLELRCWLIGRSLGLGCHVAGWFWPMYFAGRLESGNTVEYLNAAAYARALGLLEFEQELLLMSAVEKRHEEFFLTMVSAHRWLAVAMRLFGWGAPTNSQRQGERACKSSVARDDPAESQVELQPVALPQTDQRAQ